MPEKEKNEYFEVRIPKVTASRVPLFLTIILMLVSFLGGLWTMRFYYDYQRSQAVTDATGAFVSYAKELKMNEKEFRSCLESGKYKNTVTNDVTSGTALQVSATPTFFVNGRLILGAQPYSLFKEMIEQELSGNRTPLTEEEASGSAAVDVAKGNLPALGGTAPVTIVEFSDFQCPFCESFYLDTLPQLRKEYIDTGKVQLTFRHYPLDAIHPNAPLAHEASECADDQGKFWEYHNKLFDAQQMWSDLPLTSEVKT